MNCFDFKDFLDNIQSEDKEEYVEKEDKQSSDKDVN